MPYVGEMISVEIPLEMMETDEPVGTALLNDDGSPLLNDDGSSLLTE